MTTTNKSEVNEVWKIASRPNDFKIEGNTVSGKETGIDIRGVPPGCEIIVNSRGFYAVSIPVQSVSVGADGATVKVTGHYSLAPYALYDTRQGAIDCAWLCYRK